MPDDDTGASENTTQNQDDEQQKPALKKVAEEPAVAGYTMGDLLKAPAEPPEPKAGTSQEISDENFENERNNQKLAGVQEKVVRSDQQEPSKKHKVLVIAGIALIGLGALIILPLYGLRPAIITMLVGFASVVIGTFIKI